MKILIISDTHGRLTNLPPVLKAVGPLDHLIHCGDVEGQMEEVEEMAGCPCTFVKGNNDFYCKLPMETIVKFPGYRILVTHGHRFSVSWSYKELADEAKRKGCNVALFGHTHCPFLDQGSIRSGLTLLNPGSLSLPRQYRRQPTFAIMEIDSMGRALYSICCLGRGGTVEILQ